MLSGKEEGRLPSGNRPSSYAAAASAAAAGGDDGAGRGYERITLGG
jgi:hypothetical protein